LGKCAIAMKGKSQEQGKKEHKEEGLEKKRRKMTVRTGRTLGLKKKRIEGGKGTTPHPVKRCAMKAEGFRKKKKNERYHYAEKQTALQRALKKEACVKPKKVVTRISG